MLRLGYHRPRIGSRRRWLPIAMLLAASGVLTSAAEQRLAIALLDEATVAVFTQAGERVASVRTGAGPRYLLVRGNTLFVANRGVGDEPGSTLTQIDLDKLEPRRTVKVCDACAPRAMAFDGAGHLWFTGQAHRAVYRADAPAYDEPAGSVLVAWGWPTEVARIGDTPLIVVGLRGSPLVSVIDTLEMRASRVDVFPSPELVVARPGSDEIWLGSMQHARVARLNRGASTATLDQQVFELDSPLGDLAFTPDGRWLLLTAVESREMLAVNPKDGSIAARAQLSAPPARVAISGDGLTAAVSLPELSELVLVRLDEASGRAPGLSLGGSLAIEGSIGDLLWVP
ncbi:MAG: hypothetical protein JSV80_15805 [Acidobacteriota bacterium]|nr:MAG: hypothetical protein JSV80_15805 [Acidobacteriota bacterium]